MNRRIKKKIHQHRNDGNSSYHDMKIVKRRIRINGDEYVKWFIFYGEYDMRYGFKQNLSVWEKRLIIHRRERKPCRELKRIKTLQMIEQSCKK